MMSLTRRRVFLMGVLLWMAAIFAFSARDADTSTRDSHRAGRFLGRLLYRDYDAWSPEAREAFEERVDHPVRKTAHAAEYALLAVLLLGALLPERRGSGGMRGAALTAWLISAAYAVTDELHQSVVPGRSCQVTDVWIDSGGALLGLLLACGALATIHGIRKKET